MVEGLLGESLPPPTGTVSVKILKQLVPLLAREEQRAKLRLRELAIQRYSCSFCKL